jgi:hypothetical protein
MPDMWGRSEAARLRLAQEDAVRRGTAVRSLEPLTTGLWQTYRATDGHTYQVYDR